MLILHLLSRKRILSNLIDVVTETMNVKDKGWSCNKITLTRQNRIG